MKLSCRGTRFLPRLLGRTSRLTCSGWKLGDTTDEPAPSCRGGSQGYCVPPWGCLPFSGCHAGRKGADDAARDAVGCVLPGLGCGAVGIVLRCLAQPRLKRGLLTMATLRLWSGLASSGWRYQLQRRGPSLSATTMGVLSTTARDASILDERQRALMRLAQIQCTRHEPATVLNALRTWT